MYWSSYQQNKKKIRIKNSNAGNDLNNLRWRAHSTASLDEIPSVLGNAGGSAVGRQAQGRGLDAGILYDIYSSNYEAAR